MRPGARRTGGGSVAVGIAARVGMVVHCVKAPANFNELMPGVVFSDVVITPTGVSTTYRFAARMIGIAVGAAASSPTLNTNGTTRSRSTWKAASTVGSSLAVRVCK